MKTYFIQTFNKLPPIKWIGSDLEEFRCVLQAMILDAPPRERPKIIDDSINVTSFDEKEMPEWNKIFHHNIQWDWKKFLFNKYGKEVAEEMWEKLHPEEYKKPK